MPVSLLLCEGGPNSADVRVLLKLLAGRCAILPAGGKYGLGERVKARREAMDRATVFGILDGDFVAAWQGTADRPREWHASDGSRLGWRWERKEIENYLLDPYVVEKALREKAPPAAEYRHALSSARDEIATYQAARTALSCSRPRFRPLENAFGKPRGRERYPFPEDLGEEACAKEIRRMVANFCEGQQVGGDEVLARFAALQAEFQVGGSRHTDFLHTFAGKDLLVAMDETLRAFGFDSAWVFREKVLVAIQETDQDIGKWLPEWGSLQQAVSLHS